MRTRLDRGRHVDAQEAHRVLFVVEVVEEPVIVGPDGRGDVAADGDAAVRERNRLGWQHLRVSRTGQAEKQHPRPPGPAHCSFMATGEIIVRRPVVPVSSTVDGEADLHCSGYQPRERRIWIW